MNLPGKGQRMSWLKKRDSKAHFEPVKVNNGADRYCLKEETRVEGPYEFGIKPVRVHKKTDWAEVRELAQTG